MGGVGVLAATWAWFPPAAGRLSHPPALGGFWGIWGTPPDPRQRGQAPSELPRGCVMNHACGGAQLDPFPPFPGAFFTYGIEVEGGAAESRERGCVVLASDGDLYELEIGIDPSRQLIDPVGGRDERLKKLDLHPRDYILYAYDALTKVTELLLEQEAERRV